MKIQRLVNEFKDETDYLVVITNRKAIDSFFDEIERETVVGGVGSFDESGTSFVPKTVVVDGVSVYFLDEEDVENITTKNNETISLTT